MEASKRTGIDPRIIVAQAALETGWGKSAPGNNYFGIKSHGQPGGQTLATTEVVNGKQVRVNDQFRQYASPADSVQGYADFVTQNPRYEAVRQAQGLDAQVAALGQSGYATDPQYATKIGSIAKSIPIGGGKTAGPVPQQAVKQAAASMSPFQFAETMLGMGERPNRQAIQDYLKTGGANLDPATTAWCAAFVNASLGQAGMKGTGSNMARSFLNYGQPVNEPQQGDLAIFTRGDPNGPFGHVGFFAGYNPDGTIKVLGGNQGDAVSYASYSKDRLLGFRRPGDPAQPPAPSQPGMGAPSYSAAVNSSGNSLPQSGQRVSPQTAPRAPSPTPPTTVASLLGTNKPRVTALLASLAEQGEEQKPQPVDPRQMFAQNYAWARQSGWKV